MTGKRGCRVEELLLCGGESCGSEFEECVGEKSDADARDTDEGADEVDSANEATGEGGAWTEENASGGENVLECFGDGLWWGDSLFAGMWMGLL